MPPRRLAAPLVLAAALAGGACSAGRAPVRSPGGLPGPGSPPATSNVTRADYAGSAACRGCHPSEYAAWSASPMHRMTRNAQELSDAEVRAPFDGTRWRFKDDTVTLTHEKGARVLRIEGPTFTAAYRVTRVIGGRTREDFAGVDVARGGEEMVLPVSFVFATRALRYKGYSVMVHERGSLRAGPVWSRTCIFCHNTVPELDRLLGAVAGRGAHAYQGEQVDALLPDARRASMRVTDEAGFDRDLDAEVARLGGRALAGGAQARARQAIDVVRSGFDGDALVETGIGCEACHGGARAHAANPAVHPSIEARASWLSIDVPRASPAQTIDRMCARCHQVLFSRYPFTWEGGRRDLAPGGSHIASGEARDFLLGGCSASMACTTCHDPHGPDDPVALANLATPAGNAKCTPCHAALTDPGALRAHAHHDPAGAGGACIACHMARKNMGLDGVLTRYHRIGSPTDPERVLGDRPLECALCHVDRTAGQLVDAMEKLWPVRYPRQRITELYGGLDANVVRATLERGKPHEQAVAIALLAQAGARDAAPLVAKQLANPYPLVREWAAHALERLGAPAAPPGPAPSGPTSDEDPED